MDLYKVVSKFIENREEMISDEENLIEWGMDSLKFIELVVCLEEEFGILIDEEDLLLENFDTINKIERYLNEKCEVIC